MKYTFFLLHFITVASYSCAQMQTQKIAYTNIKTFGLDSELAASPLTGISRIHVIDARSDTLSFGYQFSKGLTLNKSKWPKIYQFDSAKSTAAVLEQWINNYVQLTDKAVDREILIVVRKLWLSTEIIPEQENANTPGHPHNGWDEGVISKMELYLQSGTDFYPLYRVDTVLAFAENERLPNTAALFIKTALKNSLAGLWRINPLDVMAKKRRLSFNDIHNNYTKNFETPVLKAVTYKRGVYKNFEEFRNNNPSITTYELRPGKMGDMLHVKEGNEEYPLRAAWGYCDGINMYVNSGDKYSQLVKEQNSFYFFGIKSVSRKVAHDPMYTSGINLLQNTGRKNTNFVMEPKYYMVDMETGEVY